MQVHSNRLMEYLTWFYSLKTFVRRHVKNWKKNLIRLKTLTNENEKKIKIFLVDDDAVFLKSLEIEFLQHADFDIETFATGELCLENLSHNPDVIILDYHLDGLIKMR